MEFGGNKSFGGAHSASGQSQIEQQKEYESISLD
jgi:hypothetical protein